MINQTVIEFHLSQGWGDFKILWLMKFELGKSFNGYLEKGILQWVEVPEAAMNDTMTPFMRIPRNFDTQMLIDALTNQKKATEQVETLSELKATRYHLEDMRKLVFKEEGGE